MSLIYFFDDVVQTVIIISGVEYSEILYFQAQLGLLFILLVAILNFVIGTFIPPTPEKRAKGVTGYSGRDIHEFFLQCPQCPVYTAFQKPADVSVSHRALPGLLPPLCWPLS